MPSKCVEHVWACWIADGVKSLLFFAWLLSDPNAWSLQRLKHHISDDAEGFYQWHPTWAIDAISIKASGFTKPYKSEQVCHPENILHIPYFIVRPIFNENGIERYVIHAAVSITFLIVSKIWRVCPHQYRPHYYFHQKLMCLRHIVCFGCRNIGCKWCRCSVTTCLDIKCSKSKNFR